MNKTYISNVKIPFIVTEEINTFVKSAVEYSRAVSKIIGKKIKSNEIERIVAGNGYMTLKNGDTLTPTQARDHQDWFKDISSNISKSWATIIIEWTLNRYLGTKKRNKKFSTNVAIRRDFTFNTKKNILKYRHDAEIISFPNLFAGKDRIEIKLSNQFLRAKPTLKKNLNIFLNTKGDGKKTFPANIILPEKENGKYGHFVVLIEKEVEQLYTPKKFLAFDINKSADDFLACNYPIFNGENVFGKPENIKNLEHQIKKIQEWINKSCKVKPYKRSSETMLIDLDPEFLPNHLRKPLKCNSSSRRQVRLLWKNKHKELERAVRKLNIWPLIINYCVDNQLGYAHDNVKTGTQNGTFSQDKLLIVSQEKCRLNKIPWANVTPAYTSRTCPSCNNKSKDNRKGDYFKCVSCGHEGNSHLIAAINIGNTAYQDYFNLDEQPTETKQTEQLTTINKTIISYPPNIEPKNKKIIQQQLL